MTTTFVLNPAVSAALAAPASTAGNRQAGQPVFGNTLSQVLSREGTASQVGRRDSPEQPADSPQSANADAAAGKTPATTAADRKDTARTAAADDQQNGSDPMMLPPELAAMVANLLEMNPSVAGHAADTGLTDTAAMQQRYAGAHEPDGRGRLNMGGDIGLQAEPELAPATHSAMEEKVLFSAHAEEALNIPPAAHGITGAGMEGDNSQQAAFPTTLQQPAHFTQAVAQPMHGASQRLAPYVGTAAWNQALGQQIVWMAGKAEHTASLMLHPADLGPLQVILNVSSTQTNATFVTAQPEVRQALESALPKLREMLDNAGIQLGQASVNTGMPEQRSEFFQARHEAARGSGIPDDPQTGQAAAQTSKARLVQNGNGLVDIFA